MRVNDILRYVLIGGIFLLPFLPFVVANSMFFPFITGKNFLFRILVELLFGTWMILALRDARYRPAFSWILATIVAFVAIIGVADLFGENPFKSFWSNFERMEGWITLFHLLLYFLIAGSVLNTTKLWGWFAHVSVAASVLLGIYGIFQLTGSLEIHQGGVRLDATLGNATYLAIYMVFHVFITAVLMLRSSLRGWVRYLYLIPIALQVFILYNTATRGAILGFIGGVLLTALLMGVFGRGQHALRRMAVATIVAVVVFVGIFVAIKDTSFVHESQVLSRFSSVTLSGIAKETRFVIWGMALSGAKEHPILGWGQENFNLVFNEYYQTELYNDEPWFDRVHNIVLDWLVAGGILGLLAYLFIPLAFLFHLWHPKNRIHFSIAEQSLWTGLLAAYFFHNLFVFDNITSYVLFFSILAYVHAQIGKPAGEESGWNRSFSVGSTRVLAVFVVIVVLFSAYFFNGKGIATSQALIRALSPIEITERIAALQKSASYESIGRQEVAEQSIQVAIEMRRQNLDISVLQQVFALAEREMMQEIERAPSDTRHRVFLASLYDQYGLHERAAEQYRAALDTSPNRQRLWHQYGFNRINLELFTEAQDVFRQSFELDSNVVESRIFYIAGSLYAGDEVLADELLAGITNEVHIIESDVLVNTYAVLGRFERLVPIWEARIARQPNNVQARLSLAATYLQLGRRDVAIEQIEEAIRLDPNFRQQGLFLIDEIRAGRNPVR